MRKQEDEGEALGYQGSVATPDATETVTKDEEDVDTLKQVLVILKEGLAKCDSIHVLDPESTIPVESQILGYQVAADILDTALLAAKDAIGEVKLKQRGM